VHFEATPETPTLERPQRVDEALQRVRAEIVEDEVDPAGSQVAASDPLELGRSLPRLALQ